MDRLFDRLGDLLRSLMGSDLSTRPAYDPRDPDMRAALNELDAYLQSGRSTAAEGHGQRHPGEPHGGEPHGGQQQREQQQSTARQAPPPQTLRQDYANLEVPFAAPLEQVQSSYRSLLRKYHPDRFVRDAEKQKLATEITKRLNESFQNIRRHYRTESRSG